MNTSAFVTSIRIKLIKNQYKTHFLLFAFCLLIASFSIERIMGSLISERLEQERKRDLKAGIDAALEQRWMLHNGHIRSYAYWTDIWNLIKAKKHDAVYLDFQSDTAIDKQFDFFGIYLTPENEFINKWSDGSGRKINPDRKIISYLYSQQSEKEGQSNYIAFFNQQYYLISTSALADDSGNPMIAGIMVFGIELDNFIVNANSLFNIRMQIAETQEIPVNFYDFIGLEKLSLPDNKKTVLIYFPQIRKANLIRPYIIGILAMLSIVSLGIFAWILHKLQNPSND